jgi:hypothetical protein
MNGLDSAGSQLWTQNSNGIGDVAEPDDRFGSSLADGDFDNDGFEDLAIGAAGESAGSRSNAGAVHVIFGSAAGLDSSGDQFWTFALSGFGSNKANDLMGAALGEGDFDNDGFRDLCIGVPGRDVGNSAGAGVMVVLPGSNQGPTATGDQLWSQSTAGISGAADPGDAFGAALEQ